MFNTQQKSHSNLLQLNWRLCWYSVLIWLLVVAVAGFVVLPWFYAVLPLAVLLTTTLYFRFPQKNTAANKFDQGSIFAHGLWLGFIWALSIFFLDFIEFVGFDFGNFYIYSVDARNFLKYPLVILIPVIHSLVLENTQKKKHGKLSNNNYKPLH